MKSGEAIQGDLFAEVKTAHHQPKNPEDPLHWIHFGTSTWAYPGWKGIVYSKKHSSTTDYLREYLEYPHFRTAGADFTFYRPPDPKMLKSWKPFLPENFKFVFKVWDELTVDRFQNIDQQHSPLRKENQPNPHYLNSEIFEGLFLEPFNEAGFKDHVAAFIFEFRSSTGRNKEKFLSDLGGFLETLPKDWPYAVEIREPKILGEDYVSILKSTEVSHVYNHWDRMPALSEQMEQVPLTGKAVVSRILTPLNMPYAVAKKKFAPYNELRPENVMPQMRQDAVSLALQAIRSRLPGYILVNNRSEGCAPLTIRALEEMLQSSVVELGED
ncbi:MAG: DUF72 domain-containing protein [Candidatus Omnitrophica bacterium]|nr:DUF72 domain-containing protein [Candidatus Omnitrophota bacterium]MCB9770643.1 DUF72 domain-containing protein [Candidatus Omnitrophota bacterium]